MPKRDTKKLLASHCETRNHTILIKGNNTKKMGDEGKKTKKKKMRNMICDQPKKTVDDHYLPQ